MCKGYTMSAPTRSPKSHISTAALLTLACSLGVNLPPLLAAAPAAGQSPAMTADHIKMLASQHKISAEQAKLLQGDLDDLKAAQIKLEALRSQIPADQIKLKANHIKLEAAQHKVDLAQQKLDADSSSIRTSYIKFSGK